MTKNKLPDYITCAGVRVPADWNLKMLEEALAKRNIRFHNEAEIVAVFGEAIKIKADLEKAKDQLTGIVGKLEEEKAKLEKEVEAVEKMASCPHCKRRLMLDLPTVVPVKKGRGRGNEEA